MKNITLKKHKQHPKKKHSHDIVCFCWEKNIFSNNAPLKQNTPYCSNNKRSAKKCKHIPFTLLLPDKVEVTNHKNNAASMKS